MTNRHTSEARESHDGHTRIYNPEPIIKKLQELYSIVEKVEEWEFAQNYFARYPRYNSKWFRRILLYSEYLYVFGEQYQIREIVKRKNWPTFPDLPAQKAALKRIEFVIKQVGG